MEGFFDSWSGLSTALFQRKTVVSFLELLRTFQIFRTLSNIYDGAILRAFGCRFLESFHLNVKEGQFTDSEIIVMLGENGTGKTTFIRMMAGLLPPDNNTKIPQLNVSYKPQKISPKSTGTVRMLLHNKIRDAYIHPQFITDVIKPLQIEPIFDQEVQNLSGGELQRVALTLCLGKVSSMDQSSPIDE